MTDEEPFVLDLAANPHRELLEFVLTARRRARLSDTNHAAKAFYMGALMACAKATGLPVDQIGAWLDHHDTPDLDWLLERLSSRLPVDDDAWIDLAVRSRRLARMAGGAVEVYRHWQGVSDLLGALLDIRPEDVDALVAGLDTEPAPEIAPRPGAPVEIRGS